MDPCGIWYDACQNIENDHGWHDQRVSVLIWKIKQIDLLRL